MKLERISLRGFLSHTATDWAPNGARLVSLVGANGAGKSSLLDAVAYALFDAARGKTDELVQLGATDMSATVEFEFAGARYRVTRGRTTRAGGKSFLELHVADGDGWRPLTRDSIRETQAAIAELLRVDADTFGTVVLLMQGDVNRFAQATAAERKRILSTVLGLDVYARAEGRARELARDLEAGIAAERVQLERLDERLETRAGDEEQLAEAKEQLAIQEADLAEETARRAELESAMREIVAGLAGLEAAERDVSRLTGELEALRERYRRTKERGGRAVEAIAKADAAMRSLDGAVEKAARLPELTAELDRLEAIAADDLRIRDEISTRENALRERRSVYEREAAAWQHRYETARHRVDELAAAVQGLAPVVCPQCGTSIVIDQAGLQDKLTAARREFRALEQVGAPQEPLELARERAAIDRLTARRTDDGAALAGLAVARTAVIEAREAAAHVAHLDSVRASREAAVREMAADEVEIAEIDAAGKAARAGLEAAQARISEFAPLRTQRGEIETAIAAAAGQIEQLTSGVRQLERAIAVSEGALAELDRVQAEREALATKLAAAGRELGLLRRLVAAFGVTGIPARIIESVLPELTAYAQELLSELRPGMELAIRAQRAKKDGKGLVEALDLVVRDAAGERPLALFSGGERMSVSLALAVGLSRLVARRAGTALRTLAIDEPDGLDAEARRAFGQALRILAHHGELERVVLVSHHEDLAEAGDAIYRVTKNGRGSVVEQIA